MKFSEIHTTDKNTAHAYGPFYDELLQPFLEKEINFLELGILNGGSMLAWTTILKKAKIYGIDINLARLIHKPERANLFQMNLYVDPLPEELKIKFDIIIDDADHDPVNQITAFKKFYSQLNLKGIYVIEDLRNIKFAKVVAQQIKKEVEYGTIEIIDLREFNNKLQDDILIKVIKESRRQLL